MLKHGNELDDLIDAQSRAGLPHSGVIRNGKLPYGTRQMLKHPGKAAALYLLLLPGILVVAVGMLYRILKELGDIGALITGITAAALAIVYMMIIVRNYQKAKRAEQEARQKKKKRKKRR